MPTIKEIAKACNVSVATVSNIINHKGSVGDATRERVEKVIREMNYTPNYVAKNLKTKNTRSIGVIAEDMTVFALPDIIDGITEYCEEADYQILLVISVFIRNSRIIITVITVTKKLYVRSSRSFWQSRSKELFMWLPMSA